MPNRACQILGVGLIIVGIFPLSGPPQWLRIAADRASVLVGTAVRPAQFTEAVYANTLSREYNMVEPEDAMKWWVVRHNQPTFDFGPGDEVVRFAQAHGMKVRGHCLAWSRDNPEWLAEGHFTPAELSL
jgi:endo-1,4-beta-xylanase